MNDKKKSILILVNFVAIIACYFLIFQILSKRETSTLNTIYKHLESRVYPVDKNHTNSKHIPIIEEEKIKIELPLYFENESLISYVKRMIILKQNGFWEVNLNVIFKNKDLFTVLKKQVIIFQNKYLRNYELNSINKIEKELENFLRADNKKTINKHNLFIDILELKLSYYNLTESKTVTNFDSLFSNTFGKYLMISSFFMLFLAILNSKNKRNNKINKNLELGPA